MTKDKENPKLQGVSGVRRTLWERMLDRLDPSFAQKRSQKFKVMNFEKLEREHVQRRKKRTRPPLKENHLGNFSGRKEKLSRPVVDTKTL